jgi:3-phosphoshikimate 1-carboxyvinyltransferase
MTAETPTAERPKTRPERLRSAPSGALKGRVRPPGDKSISHRALILGAMASGVTEIEGLLEGEDVLRTAAAAEAFGAKVERLGEGRWRVEGRGGFAEPSGTVDCGNSGTGVRLLMGAAAGYRLTAHFDGDASLRKRPMGRVTEPLTRMGARFETSDGARLPLTLKGGGLKGIDYRLPVASAQVKSAMLLAGLNAEGSTTVEEPERTRDHTERMLQAFGADLAIEPMRSGRRIRVSPSKLTAAPVAVPGDPSSSAFPVVAALIVPGSEVVVESVLLNPLRTGLFDALRKMGADLEVAEHAAAGEPVGDLTIRASELRGVVVDPTRAPSMIDEYPVLAACAAFARGTTVMRGIGELRVKESDRIALMAAGLKACGVEVEEEQDGLIVHGRGRPPRGGAEVVTAGDHRIAMAHLVLGLGAERAVTVDEPAMIATSFPGFVELMGRLGARIEEL